MEKSSTRAVSAVHTVTAFSGNYYMYNGLIIVWENNKFNIYFILQ